MEQSPKQADERHAPDSGRVAVPEIAELLHLQRPAAAVTAAVVVLVGLVVALVAPSVLPPTALVGFGVGVVALLAAVVAAVVLDGRDPVVRGPRHLRRDGHNVLARMAGPDPIEHGATVLRALERRLAERDHVSVALTGTGTDPSALAEAVGRGAAADGHTSLVIDLRAAGAPGVSDVGAGTVRLGEAAELAEDRPYAWIGAGADRAGAVTAAAGVARRPPRDLALLLVVAPEAATHSPELLRACDRTVLLVAADTHQRAMVSARLDALGRAGGSPEAVVVGGLQVGSGDEEPIAPDDERARWSTGPEASGRVTPTAAPQPDPTPPPAPSAVAPDVAPTPPAPPIPPAPEEEADADAGLDAADDRPDATAAAADATDVWGDLDDTGEDAVAWDAAADADTWAADADTGTDEDTDTWAAASDADADDDADPWRAATATGTDEDVDAWRATAPAADPWEDLEEAEEPPAARDDDTAPLPPVTFRTTDAEGEDAEGEDGEASDVEGFTSSDPLLTTAALEQLQRREDED